jgi:hypothetical protein
MAWQAEVSGQKSASHCVAEGKVIGLNHDSVFRRQGDREALG